MSELAGNGAAELGSDAHNGGDAFGGGGTRHATHLCQPILTSLLTNGGVLSLAFTTN